MLNAFYDACLNVAQEIIPTRNSSKKMTKAQRYRDNLTRRRRRIYKLLTKVTSPSRKNKLQHELINIEKNLQESYKKANKYDEHKAIESIKVNSKYFYPYVKKISEVKSKVEPLINEDNELTSNSDQMAKILSNQYICKDI